MARISPSVVARSTETYRLANSLGCTAQTDIYIYTEKIAVKIVLDCLEHKRGSNLFCVRLSIHLHGIIIRCLSVMLVHLKQANFLFLDFNAITAPLMYIKDQLASRTTLDQHGVALTVMRLVRKMWKVLTSSNCDLDYIWVTL